MRLHVIGLGGIGSHLLMPLLQYLNYEDTKKFTQLVFIDGDKYEQKNLSRQNVVEVDENKAIAQKKHFEKLFDKIKIIFVDKYITTDNIGKVIQDEDVVLLCVDNHKTRKVLEDYTKEVESLTVISGGNELHDGNVMVLQKVKGKYTTPLFSDMHEELKSPKDKSPEEMSCEELAQSSPQISIVNATIADGMRRTLYAMLNDKITYYEMFINCMTGNSRTLEFDNPDPMNLKSIRL